jgi:hypothetical protein
VKNAMIACWMVHASDKDEWDVAGDEGGMGDSATHLDGWLLANFALSDWPAKFSKSGFRNIM